MRRSVVLDVTARAILPAALVFAVHLLIVGHDLPGGGFVGGLVAGAAVALLFVAGGVEQIRDVLPVRPWTVLGASLAGAATTAVVPTLLGEAVLDSWKVSTEVPVLGKVEISSALCFDIGVTGVVIGLVLMVFEALGDEGRPEEETA